MRVKTSKEELKMNLITWKTGKDIATRKTANLNKLYKGKSAFGTGLFIFGTILFVAGMLNLARRGDYWFILETSGAIYMVIGALLWDWPRRMAEKIKERELAREMAKRPKMRPKTHTQTLTEVYNREQNRIS